MHAYMLYNLISCAYMELIDWIGLQLDCLHRGWLCNLLIALVQSDDERITTIPLACRTMALSNHRVRGLEGFRLLLTLGMTCIRWYCFISFGLRAPDAGRSCERQGQCHRQWLNGCLETLVTRYYAGKLRTTVASLLLRIFSYLHFRVLKTP